MSDNIFSKIPDINQIINENMQLGNWEDALADVSKFLDQFPGHEEALRLKKQIELMVQLDTGEKDDHDSRRKQMIVKTILGVSAILLILVIVIMGFQRLVAESFLLPPPTPTNAVSPELHIAFTSAETYIAAGQYDEAEEFVEAIGKLIEVELRE